MTRSTAERGVLAIGRMVSALKRGHHTDPFFVFPASDDELVSWITDVIGVRIPARAVCPGHDAPSQFVVDFFFDRVSEGLVMANRGGGKTLNTAALHLANAHHKRIETSHIGAIQAQAKRCYAYYQDGLRHPRLGAQALDSRIGETVWSNGARIEILPGTEAQTQGGHPHVVTYDELEQGRRQPYENAKSMPVERTDRRGHHLGQFLATSTRQSSMGLMQRALDEAEQVGTRVYSYCVFETMQPCDGKAGRPSCAGEGCPLWEWCEGRTQHADGWRSLAEVVAIFRRVGRDTWEAQHLCIKPEAKSLIYAPFSSANVTNEAEYQQGDWHLWLGYDWGFADPTYIALVQERDGRFYQFDELTGSGEAERTWVRAVIRRMTELPDYKGPTMEQWEGIWSGAKPWPDVWPHPWPEAAGDPSAVQLRAEFKDHGIGTARGRIISHRVESGQDVLRAAILSGEGNRRYLIHPRCTAIIKQLGNFRAKELADGSFSPMPDPDPANHAYSHGPDAMRYLFWRLRRALGLSGKPAVD